MVSKMYQAVFIDIDDTLLDFKKSSALALQNCMLEFELGYDEGIYVAFYEIDSRLWQLQKQGEISVAQVLDKRFELLVAEQSWNMNPLRLSKSFQKHLAKSAVLMEGALEVLEYLVDKYKIYAASNGILEMQISRLRLAGLYGFFTDIWVSDAVGVEKPNALFFKYALSKSTFKAEEVLFVGDSWEADIRGAQSVGIDSCYVVTHDEPIVNEPAPTYWIRSLMDLKDLL